MEHVSGVGTGTSVPRGAPQGSGTGQLGRDAFLTLLVTQLRYQNPLEPMDQGQFLTQLAQLQMVEQLTTLTERLEGAYRTEQLLHASALVGQTVEGVATPVGEVVRGVVTQASLEGDTVWLLVNGRQVALDQVRVVGGK